MTKASKVRIRYTINFDRPAMEWVVEEFSKHGHAVRGRYAKLSEAKARLAELRAQSADAPPVSIGKVEDL